MNKKGKYKKKVILSLLLTIVILFVAAGVWYGIQIYSTQKLLGRVKNMPFEELLNEALMGKEDAVVTIGVVKDGQTTYSVYGADAKELAQTEYLYEIGSVTKTMTAALIARAIQEDKLSLTDTIDKYLELPAKKTYPTIASILTHTSGLDNYYFEWGMLSYLIHPEENPFKGLTEDTILDEYKRVNLKENKDYGFEYSNYGFALLGLVLENVYDADYTELINEYLQNELGMTDTHIANGDADFEGSWQWEADDAYLSTGAVYSDISDMLLYASAQLDNNPTFTMCHQRLKQINASDKWDRIGGFCMDEIGMSWMIDTENGFIWHNGGTGLHTSYLGFCPEKETAGVILSNLSMEEDISATTLGYKKLLEISCE